MGEINMQLVPQWIPNLFLFLSIFLELIEGYVIGVTAFPLSDMLILLIAPFLRREFLIGGVILWVLAAVVKEFNFNTRVTSKQRLSNLFVRGWAVFLLPFALSLMKLDWYPWFLLIVLILKFSGYTFLIDKTLSKKLDFRDRLALIGLLGIPWGIVSLISMMFLFSWGRAVKEELGWLLLSIMLFGLVISGNLLRAFFNNRFYKLNLRIEQLKSLVKRYEEQLRLAADRIRGLNQKVEKLQGRLALLTQFHQNLGKRWNLKETLSQLASMLMRFFSYQTLIVFQYNSSDMSLVPIYYRGQYPQKIRTLKLRVGETVVGEAVKKMSPILCEERSSRLIFMKDESRKYVPLFPEDRVAMVVPLSFNNSVIGALYVGHNMKSAYSQEDLELLKLIGYELSLIYSFYQEYSKSRDLAIRDGLTGLYTHRYFQERLKEEVARAKRYGGTLSLLMIDTDNFKRFNDTYGHPEGDKLLQRIAQLLRGLLRESDIICRYGGDEFAVILPNTNKEEALKIAERIRENFSRVNLPNYEVKVTTSIGVANYPIDASDKESLINAADENLYKAKRMGRNRVVG